MSLEELRTQWSEILSQLESQNRMTWVSFFDARLAKLESGVLYLDYSDVRKFSGHHEYSEIRKSHIYELQKAIKTVTGIHVEVCEIT